MNYKQNCFFFLFFLFCFAIGNFLFVIHTLGPPVIEPPFSFPKNLQEGGRAQVTCAVSSGDMPVVFSWKKDEHQIPMNLQVSKIQIKTPNEHERALMQLIEFE